MKIWIHLNDTQLGPFDISELPLDRMTAQTPVWYEGLSYWEPAGRSAMTAHLFSASTPNTAPTPADDSATVETNVAEEQSSTVSQSDTEDVEQTTQPVGDSAYTGATGYTEDTEPTQTATTEPYVTGQAYYAGYTPNNGNEAPPKCPATYLVWSILLTVLCCNPIGIVPIILGVTVSSKYNNYNYEGARRASECTAWWLMITIVTSIMFVPLSMLTALL